MSTDTPLSRQQTNTIMTVFGLPTVTFVMAVATILAGSLGAIHYVVVHKIRGKPFPDGEARE